jgi:AraC-like DNA-binding protein
MAFKLKVPSSRTEFMDASRVLLRRQIAQLGRKNYEILIPRKVDVMRFGPNLHMHPLPELSLQISGTSSMRFLHQNVISKPGNLLLIPCGMAHDESAQRPYDRFLNYVVKFERNDVHFHFATAPGESRPMITIAEICRTSSLRLPQYFEDATEAILGGGGGKEVARGLLLAGFSGLLDVLDSKPVEKPQENAKLGRCRMLVAIRFADPALSVATLARELNCSASHLSRLFHAESGATLSRHITEARLNNAKNLLKESALSVKEIAWSCGFTDPGYFIRVFRQNHGLTPLEYRTGITRK